MNDFPFASITHQRDYEVFFDLTALFSLPLEKTRAALYKNGWALFFNVS